MAVHGIQWVGRLGGGVPEYRQYPEGTSETFAANTLVVMDKSEDGLVAAVDTAIALTGVVQEAASGVAGTLLTVLVPTTADLFTATISDAGANSAAVHARSEIGNAFSWIASTESGNTSKVTIDQADSTNEWVKVVDIYTDPLEPLGTAGGRVVFRFLNAPLEADAIA